MSKTKIMVLEGDDREFVPMACPTCHQSSFVTVREATGLAECLNPLCGKRAQKKDWEKEGRRLYNQYDFCGGCGEARAAHPTIKCKTYWD